MQRSHSFCNSWSRAPGVQLLVSKRLCCVKMVSVCHQLAIEQGQVGSYEQSVITLWLNVKWKFHLHIHTQKLTNTFLSPVRISDVKLILKQWSRSNLLKKEKIYIHTQLPTSWVNSLSATQLFALIVQWLSEFNIRRVPRFFFSCSCKQGDQPNLFHLTFSF